MELKEQVEFETPHKHKIVIRGYITGRIKQEIEAAMFGELEISPAAEDIKMKGSAIVAAGRKAMELVVISVDGSKENVLDRVLDLPADDYELIKSKIDEVTNPLVKADAQS